MTSDADALGHEIEASRGRLGRTLDSLTQRLTTTGIVEDMLGSIRHDATGAVLYDGALEAVRRNPVPVLMMCLGTVMLLKGKGPIGGGCLPSHTRSGSVRRINHCHRLDAFSYDIEKFPVTETMTVHDAETASVENSLGTRRYELAATLVKLGIFGSSFPSSQHLF